MSSFLILEDMKLFEILIFFVLLDIHVNVHPNWIRYPLINRRTKLLCTESNCRSTCMSAFLHAQLCVCVCCMHVCTYTYAISFTNGEVQIENVFHHLEKEGVESLVAIEEPLYFIWCLFQNNEDRLSTATRNLEELTAKHMEEMKEVRANNIKF